MCHLATPEHDRELDLRPLAEKSLDVAHLGLVVVLVDLRTELHLFDDDVRGLLPRFLPPLLLLVLPAVEVHDPTHGRIGDRAHFDEVEALLTRDLERFGEWLHSQLRSIRGDQANLASANAVVDAGVVRSDCGITSWLQAADAKRRRTHGKASTVAPEC